jgi:hypothetical protein
MGTRCLWKPGAVSSKINFGARCRVSATGGGHLDIGISGVWCLVSGIQHEPRVNASTATQRSQRHLTSFNYCTISNCSARGVTCDRLDEYLSPSKSIVTWDVCQIFGRPRRQSPLPEGGCQKWHDQHEDP